MNVFPLIQPSPIMQSRLIVFCFTLFYAIEASCPDGSSGYNSRCYIYSIVEAGFSRAELRCAELGGHLTSISDAFTNAYLQRECTFIQDPLQIKLHSETAQEQFQDSTDTDFWIGLSNSGSNTWTWSDGSPANFTDWKQNPGNAGCAAMSVIDGYWTAQACYKAKPFVCETPSTSFQTTPNI